MQTRPHGTEMVDHELDELRREFLVEAEGKVREMETALGSGQSDRVAYLAHQLKGSGGSYGYAQISAESAEIEKAVENLPGGDDGIAEKIQQHVANLRTEIDRRSRELTA